MIASLRVPGSVGMKVIGKVQVSVVLVTVVQVAAPTV
jgi:hypothetical protein